jgi:hypothetical protein
VLRRGYSTWGTFTRYPAALLHNRFFTVSTTMSPAKKSLKIVALPIAKLGFTDVPRISNSSYRSWLDTLLNSKPNQKLILKHDKSAIDQCFREQVMQQYALDNNKLKQALADVYKSRSLVQAPTDKTSRLSGLKTKPSGPE